MKYRQLGDTGLRVSEVGFGCGNVGGLMVRGSHTEQVQAVARAVELGINYFDTAASYGEGLSEQHLGEVLSELRPNVLVATKFHVEPNEMGDALGAVRRSLETSLRRLRRDHVDVLQLHNRVAVEPRRGTLTLDQVLGPGGIADALATLQQEGLIRFKGFTGLGETAALHRVAFSGRFDTMQAYYNLLNPSAGLPVPASFVAQDFDLLMQKAADAGLGIVVIRVLAGGALGGEDARQGYASSSVGPPMAAGGEYDADTRRAAAVAPVVATAERTLPQAAVRFALDHPAPSTVLVGYSSLAQIEEAVAASVAPTLGVAALDRLRELWARDFA